MEKIKILVIDDNETNLALIKHILTKVGYEVVAASTGQEGIEVAFKGQCQLILLDIMMPGMDGFEVMETLQADSQARKIPVIFLTAKQDSQDMIRGLSLGAQDYITKPINPEVIKLRIANCLKLTMTNKHLQTVITDLTREILLRTDVEINLRAKKEELQEFAMLDALTKIHNRRMLDEGLERILKEMHRNNSVVSFLMCDIDFFKNFNDTYGHKAGDLCLFKVAKAISQATFRPGDLVARFGGEEFALLLPDTNELGALQVAKNIQSNLKQLAISHADSSVNELVTISIGMHTMKPKTGKEIAILVERADKALYHAKNNGRNQICQCDEDENCSPI
ncbi:MAG: diguanylate cyclase [SAR324 cluster bacterium]|nr:diguanylate cyclase [SAR324 cluster bacterium]